MTVDDVLFGALPYVALSVAVAVTVVRWRYHPFTVSSLSSQLLESRKLYWGTFPFHWGISAILVGHLAALLVPSAFILWNGAPARLYLLEGTGLALGLWAAVGLTVLIWRRLSEPRIRRVTTRGDLAVLATVAVQVVTGLWIALAHRWGSYWGPAVLTPYLWSLFTFSPDTTGIAVLPVVVKVHVLAFYAFLALFPFTRLVHIITLPLQYLFRPWQLVVANRSMLDRRPPRVHVLGSSPGLDPSVRSRAARRNEGVTTTGAEPTVKTNS